ncbi:manganese transport protein MntH [Novipirellula galeiformis]|uniref:Manganese transport protein MntH n=1 Tax=Novipirellula galeiformis TaxID=2528004 RepID=A0A5C6CPE2_9BACT|nr:Nramp family divalent metal transporter [Novipirellula galeiformis]TWU26332.1 manganese transport protein MntH [Novipirellula galeiformis]
MTHPKDAIRHDDSASTLEPPTRMLPIIRCIGPGLIVAGSIVGSGELIATTKTGAEAGFSLLWLIILGCVVKVFAQIEFGRYAIVSGKTTLRALDEVPGPRIRGRGNWLVWYWVLMWIASISQLGGIVGGVGQSLAISVPLTQRGADYNEIADAETLLQFQRYAPDDITVDVSQAEQQIAASKKNYRDQHQPPTSETIPSETVTAENITAANDAAIWAIVVALFTSAVLWVGRYGLIQSLATILVASFTLLTITNLYFLQDQPDFRVSLAEFIHGLQFRLPSEPGDGASGNARPIGTALATFGIIGVGAAELVVYPYWCLEKGYARFVGRDDGSTAWLRRATGWMRVMQVDAWGAMVVYTFATITFYLLGAAILHRVGLNPEKDNMVRTLAVMFVPVFSQWASAIFLFGAFAVLYSTFFVANASHARTFSDAMCVVGLIADDPQTREKWIRWLSGGFPILCLLIYLAFPAPAQLVLLSGVAQGIMLPMLAGAALYFRYHRSRPELTPGTLWDIMLWLSATAMLVTGTWTVVEKFLG